MKTIYYLIVVALFMGCTSTQEVEEETTGYIDYSSVPFDKLSKNDIALLSSVDLQEGKLVSKIDLESAMKQGISKERYLYFLEYLDGENLKLEDYLKSGAVVCLGDKSFTRNEELSGYIDSTRYAKSLSRAYGTVTRVDLSASQVEMPISFYGPSELTISAQGFGGISSVYCHERRKGFQAVLLTIVSESETTFRYGDGNNVFWEWNCKASGSMYSKVYLTFGGEYQDSEKPLIRKPMPSYVAYSINYYDYSMQISVGRNAQHVLKAYYADKWTLFANNKFETQTDIFAPMDRRFVLVLYEVSRYSGNEMYIGEQEFYIPTQHN